MKVDAGTITWNIKPSEENDQFGKSKGKEFYLHLPMWVKLVLNFLNLIIKTVSKSGCSNFLITSFKTWD
jgi:hypothetical protein